MNSEICRFISPERWNICIKPLCQPLASLDPIRRPPAVAFHYDGRVQNGGHSSYWDSPNRDDDELLRALSLLGAREHAGIFVEARVLRNEAEGATEEEQESIWELMGDLDRRYYRLKPDILEILARYFDTHRESFPDERKT